ncbi:MAG: hypothetical protein LBT54_02660 [Bifidobacteriaceae bacterium]|jgi:antitoxin (DNA-binding transcriptional repressor) of toxin-antitoxin stability system|nr:hypothetical protein [Bifidobacteriaceae bacterium]
MPARPVISQRDLRLRSKEIMDGVERGLSFTVTRAGREIGELAPVGHGRRFIGREQFARLHNATSVDVAAFRRDQDSWLDGSLSDPYDR